MQIFFVILHIIQIITVFLTKGIISCQNYQGGLTIDKELFDDLIESCKEVIEFKKGNIQLKTTILEIPDEEIEFCTLNTQGERNDY